ncbi:hypothetical protein C8Q72DRAFT_641556 [Fomitopsis betulina]|nr:hypothetical protein C8Q72DRAFT_641556 [Fomitopsis betulina]
MHCSTRQERCCCRPWTAEQPPQPPERPQRPSRPHRQSTLPSTPLVPGHELQCWPRWPLAAIHRVRADDRTAGCLDRWRWTRLAPFRLGRNRLQHRTEHELRVITGYHFVSPTIHRDRNAARITRCPCRRRMRAQAVARRPSTYMFRQSRCELGSPRGDHRSTPSMLDRNLISRCPASNGPLPAASSVTSSGHISRNHFGHRYMVRLVGGFPTSSHNVAYYTTRRCYWLKQVAVRAGVS